jgi:pimeloyl-ACP methyl ester carboxylesterase
VPQADSQAAFVVSALVHRQLVLEDGTRIAYCLHGAGRPALVLTNGLTTNDVFWRHLLPRWTARHSVLTWDLPGHGASGPARRAQTARVESLARIVVQLMQAERLERAVQLGWSTGCQVVLELYRQAPERCLGLALLLGAAGRVLDTTRLPLGGSVIGVLAEHAPAPVFRAIFRALSQGARTSFSHALGVRLGLIGEATLASDARAVLDHIPSVDATTLQWLLRSLATHDATDALVAAQVPTLIVAGEPDPFAPAALVGSKLHRAAPRAAYLQLPRGTHTALLDHTQEISAAVEDLLATISTTNQAGST